MLFDKLGEEIFRDFNSRLDPTSGAYSIDKPLMRDWMATVETMLLGQMAGPMSAWLDSLPTDPAGLAVGDWWNNGGTPARVNSL